MEEMERHDIPSEEPESEPAAAETISDTEASTSVQDETMETVTTEAESSVLDAEQPFDDVFEEVNFEIEDEEPGDEPMLDPKQILQQARAQVGAGHGATPEEEKPDLAEASDERAWFVIHCYSGYEKKVKHNLEQRIETMGMANQIFQVVVPTEDEIEVKEGKRRTIERRVFPGYILVQMIMNDDSWYVVRNTPGVTGFVGMGNKPTPLRQEEVTNIIKRMEAEAPKVKVTFKPGQKVRIIDGPFNDFLGIVDEIDMDRAKARVMVSFFGRDTPVELDFLQVEKV
jgi:transcriptional antiterminator NusG